MQPNAVMLAVVLFGNLMLHYVSAQNGKNKDVTMPEIVHNRSQTQCFSNCSNEEPSVTREHVFYYDLRKGASVI